MDEMDPINQRRWKRRHFLQGLGLSGLAGASLTLTAAPSKAQIHVPPLSAPPDQAQIAAPPLPPLAVLALNKLSFGPKPSDFAAFQALGNHDTSRLQNYVDQQLSPDFNDDPELSAQLASRSFETLNKSLENLWADHVVNSPDWGYRLLPFYETREMAFLKAIYSKWQLNEVLADFWHNHFNVFAENGNVAPVFVHYDRDAIRPHMLGNFRQMLEAVATSTAMLYYLDNYINSDGGPNENYARELFELHGMGAENYLGAGLLQNEVPGYPDNPIGYVDSDVYEAARAFTGWRVRNDSNDPQIGNTGGFMFYSDWNDRFQKTVLGQFLVPDPAPMEHGRAVFDLIAQHPGTVAILCANFANALLAIIRLIAWLIR